MRAIDADKLSDSLLKREREIRCFGKDVKELEDCHRMIDLVDQQPTIEMVKYGKWLKTDKDGFEDVYCSACGCSAYRDEYLNEYIRFVYCPCCGAKMDMDVPHKWGFGGDGWFVTYDSKESP